jgi:hypothetical protein
MEVDGAMEEGKKMENLLKSADPTNKGTISFEKYVMLVEINSRPEEEPEGNFN